MAQWLASRFVVRNYDRMASVGAILDELGWKSLQSRRAMRLYMLYKSHYGHVEADGIQQPIPMRQDSMHLNSNTYAVPYSRTKYQKYSFCQHTIRQWNSLPEDIGCLPFTRIFREIRFESKWNTTFWVFPTENFREQRNI